jgi:hypothetical protein
VDDLTMAESAVGELVESISLPRIRKKMGHRIRRKKNGRGMGDTVYEGVLFQPVDHARKVSCAKAIVDIDDTNPACTTVEHGQQG